MKHYSSEELDTKIHGFLNKKFEKYPELRRIDAPVLSKPKFTMRMVQPLTSKAV